MAAADETNPENRPVFFTWFVRGCGCLVFAGIILAILLPALARANRDHRASCPNNLKQIALSMFMYSSEDDQEHFPPLSPEIGKLAMDRAAIYPEYFPDPRVNICPSDDDWERQNSIQEQGGYSVPENVEFCFDDRSYFYLGYVVTSDEDMELFAEVYRDTYSTGHRMDGHFEFADESGSDRKRHLWRLRVGIERMLTTDMSEADPMRAHIPIMIERLGNHTPDGANVVYLDGHVDFVRYPGKWPMTEKTVRILNELDALGTRTPTP